MLRANLFRGHVPVPSFDDRYPERLPNLFLSVWVPFQRRGLTYQLESHKPQVYGLKVQRRQAQCLNGGPRTLVNGHEGWDQ